MLILCSCKKEPIIDVDKSFVGNWKHNINAVESKYLVIESNSRGFIENYENGSPQEATQIRKWLTKNDILYFGWLGSGNEKFSIDQYPIISEDTIKNNFDTIYPNQKYIILNGNYYVK